jgi:iron complex outermembrane receptor protein
MKNSLVSAILVVSTFPSAIAWSQTTASDNTSVAQQSQAAPAPDSAHGNILEEVVITSARKRAESVQSTPVAVTALDDAVLDRAHVADMKDLDHLAPNLHINSQLSSTNNATIFLRGFGTIADDPASDPAVAVFVDGLYQPTLTGELLDLYDVDKIEVLRGPQNTFLGKNSPSGAISVTTKRPTGNLDGQVSIEYGSFRRIEGRALLDFPIIPGILAAKIAINVKDGGDYVRNVFYGTDEGGHKTKSGHLALLFTPNDRFEWLVTSFATFDRSPQQGLQNTNVRIAYPPYQPIPLTCTYFKFCNPAAPYTTNSNYTVRTHANQFQVASNMSYSFDAVTLTSVTGYQYYRGANNTDVDGLPIDGITAINNELDYDTQSEELRLTSRKKGGWDLNGKLDWVLGAYYFHQRYTFDQPLLIFAPPVIEQGEVGRTRSYALFGHGEYHLTDPWSVSFGVRESVDEKTHSYSIAAPLPNNKFYYDRPIDFHNTSYEAGTSFKFSDDKMAYIRFAQGYHAGGYVGVPSLPPAVAGSANYYRPETVNSYEVGAKTDWLDKRLRVNMAFFLGKYKDLQRSITKAIPVAPGFVTSQQNAASATAEGAELEMTAVPTNSLTVHATVGYLNTKYDSFTADITGLGVTDNSGIPFAFAPHWTIDVGGDYVVDLPQNLGTATFNADWDFHTAQSLSGVPGPAVSQNAIGLLNAGVTFKDRSEKYQLVIYGRNILNRYYVASATDNPVAFSVASGLPANWGIKLSAKF